MLKAGEERYKELGTEKKSLQAQDEQLREKRRELLAQRDRRRTNMQQIQAKTKA